jgi:hypothetical protein
VTLFLYYYLLACAQLGVIPLPVTLLPANQVHWAQVCNSCETRQVQVAPEMIEYNNARFTRAVAQHEACHIYLGHTLEFLIGRFWIVPNVEEETRDCSADQFWSSREYEDALAVDAKAWLRSRNR